MFFNVKLLIQLAFFGRETFTLTAGTDTLTGTTGNDTFTADYVTNSAGNDAKTLNLLDAIDGGQGVDTLLINGKGTAGTTPQVNDLTGTIKNIEKLVYTGELDSLASDTIDASNLDSALQSITLKTANVEGATSGASGGGTNITNLASGVAVGFDGNITDGAGRAWVNASYAATATAAKIELNNAYSSETGNDITLNLSGAALDSLTISGTTNKTSTVTGKLVVDGGTAPITGLTVNGGSTQVNVDASTLTGLKTINLSGSTGETTIASAAAGATVAITGSAQKDTITHSANLDSTTDLNVTLGAGNDKLSLTSGTIDFTSAKVVLDGGDGTDTLGLAYADIADLVATTKKATVTNFETLAVTGAATTAQSVDASKLSAFTTLVWSGTNTGTAGNATGPVAPSTAIAISKVQSAQTYSFTTNVTGGAATSGGSGAEKNGAKALTLAVASDTATDTVKLSIGDASATAATTKVVLAASAADNSGSAAASSVDATQFETVNIASVGVNDAQSTTAGTVGTNSNVIGGGSNTASIVIGTNATIAVTGTKDLTFTGAISGTNATLDASALVGGVSATMDGTNNTVKGGSSNNSIDGGAGNDTITTYAGHDAVVGGDGVDTINVGAGNDTVNAAGTSSTTVSDADTITLGAGSDKVAVSVLHGSVAAANAANSIDKITDFAAGGTDKLYAAALTNSTAANAFYDVKSVDTSAAADILAAATAAATGATVKYGITAAVNDVYLFTYGGKDYVFMDEATAGAVNAGDVIVEVTGYTGTFAKTDFIFAA